MQLIKRSLSVLRAVSDEPEGMTLQELSRSLELPAPTVHRLVGTLASERFLVRNGVTKRYSIGPDAMRLATGVRSVAQVSRDLLSSLSAETGETAFITELIGDRAVCVSLVESSRPLRLFVRVGQELPLHAAASSRTIIAFVDEDRVDDILRRTELYKFTLNTPGSISETLEHLSVIRARGFDVCDEELESNVWAVAAPIHDRGGGVVASVTVAGPIDRLEGFPRERLIGRVVAASAAISERLGFRQDLAHADVPA